MCIMLLSGLSLPEMLFSSLVEMEYFPFSLILCLKFKLGFVKKGIVFTVLCIIAMESVRFCVFRILRS